LSAISALLKPCKFLALKDAQNGHLPIVQYLVRSGANIESSRTDGYSKMKVEVVTTKPKY
jgi:hypothetical protein